uniref:Domain of unknown function DB domain-containing protein n=1 Tax=Ditylenchus dipsaci TaxID=166011 RepID=A0A915EJJ1_9BILA
MASADQQDDEFAACCTEAGFNCTNLCHYPPAAIGRPEMTCILDMFNPWIKCYANGKDNRECCKAAGVTGQYEKCLDFCNGVDPQYTPSSAYINCPEIRTAIVKCNHDSRIG